MRIVGLDIHRIFAEAVMLDEGKVVRLGRVGMTRNHLVDFAYNVLTHDDYVVVEATGNATAVAQVLAPHVGAGGDRQPTPGAPDRRGTPLRQWLPAGGMGA